MKVKNGMASSRSFDMMPKSGRAAPAGSPARSGHSNADQAEKEADRRKREGDGEADKQEDDHAREHQWRQHTVGE